MTLVLSSLPDLSERVARGRFADQLRGESAIVFGITREATSAAGEGPLSLRAALGGREEVLVGRSRLVVDDDVFLVLNRGTLHATRIRADEPVFSFAVYFCDALVAEVLAWGTGREDGLMEPGASAHASDPEPAVAENLRPHDRCLSPALRYLMLVCRERTCEQLWYDEQLHLLLERILAVQASDDARVTSLRAVRPRTRREIHRRIARATDFILSNYDAPIDLKSMAAVACLEKHHFLKLFSMVHGITPFEFLRRKRLAVALRMLRHSSRSHGEIARIAGLGTRHTLLRALKEFTGSSPQDYKRTASPEASAWHGDLARLLVARRGNARYGRSESWRHEAGRATVVS